jgi:carbon storage regulator
MLVLTRGLKQQIVIGDQQVIVTVLDVKGGRVRLGIEAPADVSIRRIEVDVPAASGQTDGDHSASLVVTHQ